MPTTHKRRSVNQTRRATLAEPRARDRPTRRPRGRGSRADSLETAANAARQSSDHLDYEDLLAIGECLGSVKSLGLSPFELDLLPFHRASSEETVECAICLANISLGDYVIPLSCLHTFHCTCMRAWLAQRANCPVCRVAVPHPIVEIND